MPKKYGAPIEMMKKKKKIYKKYLRFDCMYEPTQETAFLKTGCAPRFVLL